MFKAKNISSKCVLLKSSIGNNTVEIEAPPIIYESYKFILPPDSGNNNEFLKSDGNGNLSWDSTGPSPGGNVGEIQLKNNDNFIGYSNLKYNGTKLTVNNLTFTGNTISSTPTNTNITLSPNGIIDIVSQIKFQNGSQGISKVLSSNVNGDVNWEAPSGGATTVGSLISKLTVPT